MTRLSCTGGGDDDESPLYVTANRRNSLFRLARRRIEQHELKKENGRIRVRHARVMRHICRIDGVLIAGEQ